MVLFVDSSILSFKSISPRLNLLICAEIIPPGLLGTAGLGALLLLLNSKLLLVVLELLPFGELSISCEDEDDEEELVDKEDELSNDAVLLFEVLIDSFSIVILKPIGGGRLGKLGGGCVGFSNILNADVGVVVVEVLDVIVVVSLATLVVFEMDKLKS